MTWTIAEVALMSGVSVPTLRHYDTIGLLAPGGRSLSGSPLYGESDLSTLQHVLVLRQLGLPLDQIAPLVAEPRERRAALEQQLDEVTAERDRLDKVVATVQAALDELDRRDRGQAADGADGADSADGAEIGVGDDRGGRAERAGGGSSVRPETLFAGMDAAAFEPRPDEYGLRPVTSSPGDTLDAFVDADADDGASTRWPGQVADVLTIMQTDDVDALRRDLADRIDRLGQALVRGDQPEDAPVQAIVAEARDELARVWQPDYETFVEIGRMIVDDPDVAESYEDVAPGLAAFTARAYAIFAAENLR